jgi:putative membrane protein
MLLQHTLAIHENFQRNKITMVLYNPKEWITAIFRFHKADTLRPLLFSLIFIALFSAGIVYIETEYFNFSETTKARNLTIFHSLLGFAISMLLVFRTNTAYERWWEGRKLWGSLVNNSRNLSIKLNVMIPRMIIIPAHFSGRSFLFMLCFEATSS